MLCSPALHSPPPPPPPPLPPAGVGGAAVVVDGLACTAATVVPASLTTAGGSGSGVVLACVASATAPAPGCVGVAGLATVAVAQLPLSPVPLPPSTACRAAVGGRDAVHVAALAGMVVAVAARVPVRIAGLAAACLAARRTVVACCAAVAHSSVPPPDSAVVGCAVHASKTAGAVHLVRRPSFPPYLSSSSSCSTAVSSPLLPVHPPAPLVQPQLSPLLQLHHPHSLQLPWLHSYTHTAHTYTVTQVLLKEYLFNTHYTELLHTRTMYIHVRRLHSLAIRTCSLLNLLCCKFLIR